MSPPEADCDGAAIRRLALPLVTLRRFPWIARALDPIEAVALENPLARPDAAGGWGAKTSAAYARALARARGLPFTTLEDGPYRSVGLGKAGAASLSLTLDRRGVYHDARTISDFEAMLLGPLDAALEARGARLRAFVAEKRLSKYNCAPETPTRLEAARGARRILLVDQVARDRSLTGSGANEATFAAMREAALQLARDEGAAIFVKSHPDVAAGYGRGMFGALGAPFRVAPEVGPHALLDEIDEVWTASSQFGFDALLRGVKVVTFAVPFYAGWGVAETRLVAAEPHAEMALRRRAARGALSIDMLAGAMVGAFPRYFDPVTRRRIDAETALERLADWRDRVFARKGPFVAVGFARHKRDLLRAHLGAAGAKIAFARHEPADVVALAQAEGAQEIVVWSERLSEVGESAARAAGLAVTRVEDGFVRSRGLGRRRTPAASWCFDAKAIHFDASRASSLEESLQTRVFCDAERARGAALRERVVASGVTKYNLDAVAADLSALAKGRRIALVAAQVPGDASWRHGNVPFTSNLEFAVAVRAARPDAFLVFKEHPDLVAGLRPGATPRGEIGRIADLVLTHGDAARLYRQCDEVHVMTSLSGFEALLRGCAVTCWGVPFYAGWGLTEDRTPCPRRTRRLTLDELTVAALALYPAYIDAATGVPCRVEDILDLFADARR
jgi:capsular polysaccharide export protein